MDAPGASTDIRGFLLRLPFNNGQITSIFRDNLGKIHMPSSDTQFKKGHPGRPKGTRNKITKAFLKALAADFKEHGKSVIERVHVSLNCPYLWTLFDRY